MPGPLVDADWLLRHHGDAGLAVVDCRWRLGRPGAGEEAHLAGHVPGASFLDVDRDLAGAPGPGGRHPLPHPAAFERAAARAGIGRDSLVIAYDDAELGGAARLWWLLEHFGHPAVAVLDGGLAAWVQAGGQLEAGPAEPVAAGEAFRARPRGGDVAGAEELLAGAARHALVDARAPERFRGEHEPIDPVAGHIPGARNVPFGRLAPGGRYLPPDRLRELLDRAGAGQGVPLVAYCGSGVSACTVLLAARVAGLPGGRLYAGSWSEWSGRGLPAERG